MLFITNRVPKGTAKKIEFDALPRDISFDLQNTDISANLYFCERDSTHNYKEIGHKSFFTKLKELTDRNTQILLYIHGFNNTDEKNVFPNAMNLETQINEHAKNNKELVKVVPIIWPCDDDSALAFVDDYWDDQVAADLSGKIFYRLLGKFFTWQKKLEEKCYRRINILAHSMGNRVLMNALHEWSVQEGEVPQLFRNVFLAAADIKNEALEKGNKGEHIVSSGRNIVIYHANDDLAMPASKIANVKNKVFSRRLGMTGPESLEKLPSKVYQVDCDNFNNTIDVPTGHGYFTHRKENGIVKIKSPIIKHMSHAIKYARVDPSERVYTLPRP